MSRQGRAAIGLAAMLAAAPPAAGQEAPEARALDAPLRAVLAQFEGEADLSAAARLETLDGALLFDQRGAEPLVIASNMKVFTTAAALLALGAEWRWTTRAVLAGATPWLLASGDPSLRTLGDRAVPEEFLDAFAAALREVGAAAAPELVLDPRAFAGPAFHPLWPADQRQAEYCAPVWALALEGGCIEIEETAAGLRLRPEAGDAFRVARASTADREAWSAHWEGKDLATLRVRGSGLGKAPLRLADADPQRTALGWLRSGLERRGVRLGALRLPRDGEPAPGGAPFFVQRSAWTLGEAVTACNQESDNFLAETLLKTLGRERGGAGDSAAGIAAMRATLAAAGVDVATLDAADGSGLARSAEQAVNRASPAAICSLLRTMGGARAAACGPVFFDSLRIGGSEGRDRALFADAVFQPARVRYKTGWIAGASSLCGYLLAPDGRVLVFSIVVNYRRDGTARTNNARFRAFQEQLLREALAAWPAP